MPHFCGGLPGQFRIVPACGTLYHRSLIRILSPARARADSRNHALFTGRRRPADAE